MTTQIFAPIAPSYSQGDEISLKVNISSSNSYFNEQVNLFESTDDEDALLVLDDDVFNDNTLTFLKGSQGKYSNWFILPYNSQSEMYELDVKIKLNRLGEYAHANFGNIQFGLNECPDYVFNALLKGVDGQIVNFSVKE